MDELRKYLGYALKGLASFPLAAMVSQGTIRYNEAISDTSSFSDEERFTEIDEATGQVLGGSALFAALWGIQPQDPPLSF
jgi:hypothetical protein